MAFGHEEPGECRTGEDDPDTDSNPDSEGKRRKQGRQPEGPGDVLILHSTVELRTCSEGIFLRCQAPSSRYTQG